MPFKHNAARRHHIPKARYRVQNWPAYEAGLKRRGDLTLWLDEAAIAEWQAPRRTTPGGQAWYSDAAIELVLVLRLVFHLALRQAEGFAASLFRLLGQEQRVPDHTTLSRRSRGFAGGTLEVHAEVVENLAGVREHVHEVRHRRALVAADVGDSRLQQRFRHGENALAPELVACAGSQCEHFVLEGSFSHGTGL